MYKEGPKENSNRTPHQVNPGLVGPFHYQICKRYSNLSETVSSIEENFHMLSREYAKINKIWDFEECDSSFL